MHSLPPDNSRRAIFLDRDGTIIIERDYIKDPNDVALIPGAAEALRRLAGHGYALVVITNQSGIARGYLTELQFHTVQQRVEELLVQEDIRLDGVYFCPHHPKYTGPCECRKPGPGLYLQAQAELNLDLAASWYIGDRARDVEAAQRFGGRGVLLRTGHGASEADKVPPETAVFDDLAQASVFIAER